MREKDALLKHLQSDIFESPRNILYADELTGRTLNTGLNLETGLPRKVPKFRFCGLCLCTLLILSMIGSVVALILIFMFV